jgi:DNA-binding CsgD family transcriptional regulator
MMYQSDKNIIPIPRESDEFFDEISTLKREFHEFKQKWEEGQLELSENDVALDALAKKIANEKFKIKLNIAKRLHSEILPLLKEIKREKNPERSRILADLAITKLIMFIPSPDNPYSMLAVLTPMEMRIAAMIKDGVKSEDIARLQFVSIDTIKSHRSNIRKKLGLKNKQINLTSYLNSIFS